MTKFINVEVRTRTIGLALVLLAWPALAAESIEGVWLLTNQQMGKNKAATDELTLRVHPVGKGFEFAYSVPVNDIQFVSLRFTSKLNGAPVDITNASEQKIGTVTITKAGGSLYKIAMQGPNRPTSLGTMTISADGKTLTSESESKPAGQTTAVKMTQVFARQKK